MKMQEGLHKIIGLKGREKVLGIDRPSAGGFLRLMGPSGPKVHCATACGGKVVPLGTKGGRVVVAAFAAAFEKGARLTAAGCVEEGGKRFSRLTSLWPEGS